MSALETVTTSHRRFGIMKTYLFSVDRCFLIARRAPALISVASILVAAILASPTNAESPFNFSDHVAPIFEKRCVSCHGSETATSGLDLSSHRGAMAGGSSG